TKRPDYYGSIENMDHQVGRLLDKLDDMGVRDNTFVVFTSDNGSYMPGSNDPLKGRKTQLWEGGIREPGIIRWPGRVTPGSVNPTPAGVVDLLPTVCDVAGVPAPTDRTIDGTSLVPLFARQALSRLKPLYWFYSPSRPVCVIRDGDYALIADPEIELSKDNMFLEEYIGPIKETKLTNFRLFHLPSDAGQQNDLSAQEGETYRLMKEKMLTLHAEVVQEAYDWRRH
ncbi:MAG: sulfatase-like hydrolase/transferase, partial [bacterium]|nr:sulfatase-like hydrolase/transferase [bacterium]